MSEYQYVAFRAIDRSVSQEDLQFMQKQSSRAEITAWSFENEYHYGDFRGNAEEMLRRGYDIHLHYASFGIRRLFIRLPHGLPDARAVKPYLAKNSPQFLRDKQGPGGILAIEPFHEGGDLDELWDLKALLERLVPLRGEILEGDLRPLYLAHLAVAGDGYHDPEKTKEAPVPAGLGALSDAQEALAELYGLGDDLIAAVAQGSPSMSSGVGSAPDYSKWLRQQPEAAKNAWLGELMADSRSAVRAEILAKYKTDYRLPAWPTTRADRTIAELRATAAEIASAARRKAADQAARERTKRLASLAADPKSTLRETERLVSERTTQAYRQVAQLLADLREALSASDQSDLAEVQAKKLKAANPKLHRLMKELRSHGFVPK